MTGDLRAIDMAHGLMLLATLAASLVAPDLTPWGLEALFILAGFQLRLADRRFALRADAKDWFSHILMAPARLLRWAMMGGIALLVMGTADAIAVLVAALLCELLLYRTGTWLLGRRALSSNAAALALLLILAAVAGAGLAHHLLGFLAGLAACLVWLRGPDGEPRALALALGGSMAAAAMPVILPAALPFAAPVATICMAWALAHMAALRPRPMPWRLGTPPIRLSPPLG